MGRGWGAVWVSLSASFPRRLLCQGLCWALEGVGAGGEEGWECCLLSLCEIDRHTRPDSLRSWKEASVHHQGSREGTPGRGKSVLGHGDVKERGVFTGSGPSRPGWR